MKCIFQSEFLCVILYVGYITKYKTHSECTAEPCYNEQTSAAVSSLSSCHVNVSPLEGARRPIRTSHHPTLCHLISMHGGEWAVSSL